MNLSEHFTLEEMTHSDIGSRKGYDNTPNDREVANLRRLCGLLEKVKEVVGNKPVFINSGFRSKQVNDAVGSKDSSQHRIGCAADIRVPGMTPKQVISACILARLPYDQIILEFDAWVHISVPSTAEDVPRNKALIIDKLGTRNY
jgi:zinc D-Ala-D-Ala carboxypeptidase